MLFRNAQEKLEKEPDKKFKKTYIVHYLFIGGQVLEVCLAKWWANIGAVKVSYTITFSGITPSSKEIMFHGSDGITRIDLKSSLHQEEVKILS